MAILTTQVAIVGAGPAGLLLGHLLHLNGIDSIILEKHSREHVIDRVRAGVLEQGTVDLLRAMGVGAGVDARGLRHQGLHISVNGRRHRIDLADLTGGRAITVYGQNEMVKDLIDARTESGRLLYFGVEKVTIGGLDSNPNVGFRLGVDNYQVRCGFVAGCDGFRGPCRATVPRAALTVYERTLPFAWLGILAEAAPSCQELVYAYHERGFALFSMRSADVTRLYFQVAADATIDTWSDDAIWEEMLVRLTALDGWKPNVGRIVQKSVTPMRSFVATPMRHGRLFLAGDAAHIVPPTGAKGLNLAASDVLVLARAFKDFYERGATEWLDRYSDVCSRRVWAAQRFSWWLTSALHRFPEDSAFDRQRQVADLDYLTSSRSAMESLAEQYVGSSTAIPFESVGLPGPMSHEASPEA